ncbi:glutathione S-transferase [Sulfitobacter donghicola]|uniref:Glutathione S-transferase n=1 Tax=Sulfitobacter donghicola DSW-25 = KCTC 12864 = JCM 14565 TaxID=1300350 RepID=A0A073ILY1_9RHOB|nr:glutathione S-transferase [Sulfitobacter donghicola]KEJ90759.1 glutathione S-transferase [Sulfitobacter donghicola DSW-25 = KCTC 12864 = JCM 14565]KIN68017.1 Glutathione S-transferase family protein [Sulfitobacter donghicola DSW-25 = KCTC 12864 = JCM 14565]
MKLYYAPTSPYVRKIMILVKETGQEADVELINVATTPLAADPKLLAANPLAKIPALERPDGPTLYDSRVIAAYLDARGGDQLYPSGARRWDTLTLEATADGIMEAAVLMTYEARLRPEEKQMPEWVEGQWSKIERAIATLNTRWMSNLQGPLDMGQIGVACALAYVDFRHGSREWRRGNDGLAAWFKEFESRESMVKTAPPMG